MDPMPAWSDRYLPIVEAFARLLHPHGEIVLYDLASHAILGAWNTSPKSRRGHVSPPNKLLPGGAGGTLMGPHESITTDGRRITSVSAVLQDESGRAQGLLCVNLDRSPIDHALAVLSSLAPRATGPRRITPVEHDWREQIALLVENWCRERHLARESLKRSDRCDIIRELHEADLFATRNAARHVAMALGVSRATVYSMLQEVQSVNATAEPAE